MAELGRVVPLSAARSALRGADHFLAGAPTQGVGRHSWLSRSDCDGQSAQICSLALLIGEKYAELCKQLPPRLPPADVVRCPYGR